MSVISRQKCGERMYSSNIQVVTFDEQLVSTSANHLIASILFLRYLEKALVRRSSQEEIIFTFVTQCLLGRHLCPDFD
ncbi:hypothetical protein KIN20_015099 [Parelaphostrongylus tenuis]|uniref:Uncharacterized protein n=1 Tax=Parelaphostrongylus tenuis TaxID=148309 RepID=A0AAD5QS99_PARTN|nr:hypothetical protein KIN20_015099 [Parelaphostrongylus tenuis]